MKKVKDRWTYHQAKINKLDIYIIISYLRDQGYEFRGGMSGILGGILHYYATVIKSKNDKKYSSLSFEDAEKWWENFKEKGLVKSS